MSLNDFYISYRIFIDITCLERLHNYCNKKFENWNKSGNIIQGVKELNISKDQTKLFPEQVDRE